MSSGAPCAVDRTFECDERIATTKGLFCDLCRVRSEASEFSYLYHSPSEDLRARVTVHKHKQGMWSSVIQNNPDENALRFR
jgi:hypothetical protein